MTLDVGPAPLAGAPGELAGRAHDAARASALLAEARTSLRPVHAGLSAQRGAAVVAAAARLASVDERLHACATVLDGAATTLRRHATVLAELQAGARQALADRDAALARERHWQAEADEARRSTWNTAAVGATAVGSTALGSTALGATALGSTAPGDDPTGRLMAAEQQLAAARADVVGAEARWRAARDAQSAESRRAAGALGAFADVRAVGVAAAAGMSATQYSGSAAQGRRTAALLSQAVLADEQLDRRSARTALHALLAGQRDDPAFWATFWDEATPQQVYLALGPDPADPGPVDAALRGTLTAGVAHWAQTASPAERRELGHAAVVDVGGAHLGLTLRSELAAALLAGDLPAEVYAGAGDALEQRWAEVAQSGAQGLPTGTNQWPPTGDVLTDATITAPLAAAVLAGYARHPRLALDRLAPADGTGVAARRWLGWVPRDGWPDGGRAVTGALATAVGAGTASDNRSEQTRAALLIAHATKEMPRGLLSGPTLSDAASARIAEVYEPYLSSVGDAAWTQTIDPCDDTSLKSALDAPPAPGVDTGADASSRAPVVQPELDAFALRDVIAATSRTTGAAEAWLGATDRHTAGMVDLATSGAYDSDAEQRNTLVESTLADVGAVTGSMQAERLDEAYDTVATRETLVSLTGIGMGVGTIGRKVATSSTAAAASTGLGFLDMSAPVAEALTEVSSVKEQTYFRYATTMHDLVVAHDLDVGVPLDQARKGAEAIDPLDEDKHARGSFIPPFTTMSETSHDKECE